MSITRKRVESTKAEATNAFFPYAWHLDNQETEITIIRIYGLNAKNESVCVIVSDFTPYVYLELPDTHNWTASRAQMVSNLIDERLKRQRPLIKRFMHKKRLYYAYLDKNKKRRVFPYLFLAFSHKNDIRSLETLVKKPIYVTGLGSLQFKVHEGDVSPFLQLTCVRDIPTSGWIRFRGDRTPSDDKTTYCDYEFKVKYTHLFKHEDPEILKIVPQPLIMSFDIEVNSENVNSLPNAGRPRDKIFQISCVFARQGEAEHDNYLLSLGYPDPIDETEVRIFDTEGDLLEGYVDLIHEKQPNIILGFNIFTFDIPYMIERAIEPTLTITRLLQQGFPIGIKANETVIKWSSAAYKNQSFRFIDAEGRLFVDLLPIIRRDYKLSNYRLNTIAEYFLKQSKDPLTHKGIFKCYRQGMEGGREGAKALALCGEYCIQDSALVLLLFEKLQIWVGLVEMAKLCRISPFSLFTQGQQVRVFAQIYYKAFKENFVVEKNKYKSTGERYQGAWVCVPIPGVYDRVVPTDFSSLYPSVIIAYNIDYSTLVLDKSIPDEDCHVVEWTEHLGCKHDTNLYADCPRCEKRVYAPSGKTCPECRTTIRPRPLTKKKEEHILCGHHRYRFLKEPEGIMPSLLRVLLNARALTKKEMKAVKKQIDAEKDPERKKELQLLYTVLDKRQLAQKVVSNSSYGFMGVHEGKGYLPFMVGAMATTALGRISIQKTAEYITKKFKGKLIYGDSVVGDTPVLCQIQGKVVYRTIDNIVNDPKWSPYHGDKEMYVPNNIKVWSDTGFTQIKKVIRHKTEKVLYRVLTHTGVVIVTEDHSLLDINGKKISPIHVSNISLLSVDLPKIKSEDLSISVDEAYVMGLFYADGSCGDYTCPSGNKASWAINKANRELLQFCQEKLNRTYALTFKIIDTIESSKVYKLIPTGRGIRALVSKYRNWFYDKRGYKKVPDDILLAPTEIRQAFLDGYYAGDGDKDRHGYFRYDTKGQIGAAGLYYLTCSLGYKVSINTRADKLDIYRLTGTKRAQRKNGAGVKKVEVIGATTDYVYDLETENHHFSAGIGRLVVHNTDSNYFHFPHLTTAKETWDYALKVAEETSKLFPPPMKLEFENVIYWRFLILTKKRYACLACDENGVISEKIHSKGILLSRRDNSKIIRDIYSKVITMIFNHRSRDDVISYIDSEIERMLNGEFTPKDFIITKQVGELSGYKIRALPEDEVKRAERLRRLGCNESGYWLKALPAQAQLAERMKRRGTPVPAGTRLEYVITTNGGHKTRQGEKIEDYEYFMEHSDMLELDYLYYLRALSIPLDELLEVAFGQKNHVRDIYKNKVKEIPKIVFEN